ncbi:hypothetical protein [Chryseobacterium oranimense]|uniref:hypothetical protein n=1 Tax=Chryseobacterium oranimense TaxID=421058 RepID=UPI0022369246|nr:hypothetical protein [Chryseobacterium oranimense]
MRKAIHFKALINYFKTEKGGLVSPVSDGFRAFIKFPFELKSYIAVQTFNHTELIFPGDSVSIEVTLIDAEQFLEKLYEGMDFELIDNSGTIGAGIITEVM